MATESSGALSRAALFAARSPALYNSQPWHWFVGPDTLDLRLGPARVLQTTDPEARLAVLSCGAACTTHGALGQAVRTEGAGLTALRAPDRVGLPRGAAIEHKGGKDTFYAVHYAARVASELGADVVKVNFPQPEKHTAVPAPYGAEFSSQEAIDAVVRAANRTMLLVSGGSRASDDVMIEKAEESMATGAPGLIFGRNIWQRDHDESLRLVDRLRQILAKYPTP